MAEHKLFDGTVPAVSTFGFHEHRERAPHLEQGIHQPRLHKAFEFVADAVQRVLDIPAMRVEVSDLGCGDGGLLSLVQDLPCVSAWGYDFQPSNAAGWAQRGVYAEAVDVFAPDSRVVYGDVVVTTEVLEHLADPHAALRRIHDAGLTEYLVASSPWTESAESHDECHSWAWDQDGYRALIEQAGFTVLRHETVGMFQVVLAAA